MTSISINLMLNEGDLLEDVILWRIETVRQNLKVSSERFRKELLRRGLGHAFFQKFLWLCSVSKEDVEKKEIMQIAKEYFKRFDEIDVTTTTLTSDELWLDVGIVLVRDALSYTLRTKLRGHKDIILMPKRRFYSSKFITSGMYTGVIVGISLDKILRVNLSNIGIVPSVDYECVDYEYKIVKDPQTRSKLISRVSKGSSKKYEEIIEDLLGKVFPLDVYLSDRKLLFKGWKFTIKSEERKERDVKQVSLEEWFK